MGYKKSDLYKIDEMPEEVAASEDLQLQIYCPKARKEPEPEPDVEEGFTQEGNYLQKKLRQEIAVEHILLYSVELQSFWIKLNRPDVSDWTKIEISQILDGDSSVTQVEYTLGKELLAFVYYSPQSKSVNARLFKVQPPTSAIP